MVAGAVFGAIVGAVLVLLLGPLVGWWDLPPVPFLVAGARLGAAYGVVLGPFGAWLLMRDVPLGRAVGGTALGAVAGGVVAFMAEMPGPSPLYGPVAGFTLAALALRVHARRRLRGAGHGSARLAA
jgi:hypothetical protein